DDDRQRDAACAEVTEQAEDRCALEAELGHDADGNRRRASPVPPCLELRKRVRRTEKGMSLGVTGHADGGDAMGFEQAAGSNVAARPERPPGDGDIARDEQDAPDIGLAAPARQKIAERLA